MEKSGFFREKAKFFIFRGVSYFSLLLLPFYLMNLPEPSVLTKLFSLVIYNLFMVSQWYFLGKEIDHRLKIYIEVNSSIDRIIERALLGFVVTLLYFNLLSLLGEESLKIAFWGTWLITGLFYSWPTRGKIIQESIAGQMKEFRYLDAFSKTTLFCAMMMFIFSTPKLPLFTNIEAFKLYIDPAEQVHPYLWNFMYVNFLPFMSNERVFSLAWSLSLYLWGAGILLVSFYALTRYLVSRRLALLATFGLVSSWSFSILLRENYFNLLSQMFVVVWVWSLLLVMKSSVYRSGLFYGLVSFLGVVLNPLYFVLFAFGLVFIYFEIIKTKNTWHKKQFFKYASFGIILSLLTLKTNHGFEFEIMPWEFSNFLLANKKLLAQKSFYLISFFGLIPVLSFMIPKLKRYVRYFSIDTKALFYLLIATCFCFALSMSINKNYFLDYSNIWIYPVLAIVALEWIFQSMRRFRSRRNLTYSVYFLICLLDSHFELRMADTLNFFSSETFLNFINN